MVTMERKTSGGVFTVTVSMEAAKEPDPVKMVNSLRELATIHREAAATVDELARTFNAFAESWLRPSAR